MPRRSPLPQGLGDSFRVAAARASGVSPKRLRGRDLTTLFAGTRTIGAENDLHALCRAFLTIAPVGFAFSHATAARLYGMPLPRLEERSADLEIVSSGRAIRRRGIRGHSSSEIAPRMLGPLPVVAPELAWLQLASRLSLDEVVVAGDHLVRRKGALSTLEQLTHTIDSATGLRYVSVARNALRDIRPGTDSPPESRLRLLLVRAGLPEPLVGFEVHDHGYWVGTPDLAYPDHRIAIEYQGSGHRTREVFEDDIDRLERFHAADWLVIQVTASHFRDPARIVSRVDLALRSRMQRDERTRSAT